MDTLDAALFILRLGVGLVFAAHGAQKIFGWWGGPGIRGWRGAMERMGYRPVTLFAAVSSLTELGGGMLLTLGLFTPVAGAALVAQSVAIIGQAHWQNGFFNSKGGFEFPLVLGAGAATLALLEAGGWSLDAAIGFELDASLRVGLIVAGIVAGLVALSVPRLSTGRTAPQH